jgi:hypothetical protein
MAAVPALLERVGDVFVSQLTNCEWKYTANRSGTKVEKHLLHRQLREFQRDDCTSRLATSQIPKNESRIPHCGHCSLIEGISLHVWLFQSAIPLE